MADLNPKNLVRQVGCPIIIIQGAMDIQVSNADALILADAANEAGLHYEMHILSDLDHLFMRTKKVSNTLRYADKRRRPSQEFVRILSGWISRLSKAVISKC